MTFADNKYELLRWSNNTVMREIHSDGSKSEWKKQIRYNYKDIKKIDREVIYKYFDD